MKRFVLVIGILSLLPGCGQDKEARIKFSFGSPSPEFSVSQLLVYLPPDYGYEVIRADDFSTGQLTSSTGWYETRTRGKLFWAFYLQDTLTGETIAGGVRTLDLKEDWCWVVGIRPAHAGFEPNCFGCWCDTTFAINPDYVDTINDTIIDSVFIILSGNSISNPVIY